MAAAVPVEQALYSHRSLAALRHYSESLLECLHWDLPADSQAKEEVQSGNGEN